VRFAIVGAISGFRLCLELHVPHGSVTGSFQIGSDAARDFSLESGIGKLEAEVDAGADYCPVSFRVDGAAGAEDGDGRRLAARLIGLWVDPVPPPNVEIPESRELRDKNREIARLTAQLSARTGLVNDQYRRAEFFERVAKERLAAMLAIRQAAEERLAVIQEKNREIARLTAQLSVQLSAKTGSRGEKH
jgi:hypothetical protein